MHDSLQKSHHLVTSILKSCTVISHKKRGTFHSLTFFHINKVFMASQTSHMLMANSSAWCNDCVEVGCKKFRMVTVCLRNMHSVSFHFDFFDFRLISLQQIGMTALTIGACLSILYGLIFLLAIFAECNCGNGLNFQGASV